MHYSVCGWMSSPGVWLCLLNYPDSLLSSLLFFLKGISLAIVFLLIIIWGQDFLQFYPEETPWVCLLGILMSVYPILTLFWCHNVILLLYWGQSNSCSLLNGADSGAATAGWLISCVFSLSVSLFIYFVLFTEPHSQSLQLFFPCNFIQ